MLQFRWLIFTSMMFVSTTLLLGRVASADDEPKFEAETIDDEVMIGYGTALGDVDGDGSVDIMLADKKQFVWYESPSWKKHVLAENLTERDNVCIAARDIDGDGKVEIAVGAQWNPGDTVNSGAVFYLDPPKDRTKPWRAIQLPNEPVVHRMRWLKLNDDRFVLVVSPLHGRGNKNGEGAGVKLIAYERPEDVDGDWASTLLDDSLHVTHNLDPVQWDGLSESEELLYAGREGAMLISLEDGRFTRSPFPLVQGSGEIRMGLLDQATPFLATIEPFHGNELVVYRSEFKRGQKGGQPNSIVERILIDRRINAGHAIATADLFGDGRQEIVAGWRSPNDDGIVGLRVYWAEDAEGREWKSMLLDDNTMACEDARTGDLNGDGLIDIVASGRATHNLKIYWNRSR